MKKGFTLVEILIIVIILGILAAIVIPQFAQMQEETKQQTTAVTDASEPAAQEPNSN